MYVQLRYVVGALLACVCLAAGSAEAEAPAFVAPADLQARFDRVRRPAEIPFPAANPYTQAGALLGRTLFFDARLSASGSLSCASCHNPSFGWEDGLVLGHGAGLRELGRHTPTILNAAWGQQFFWDGRAPSLEAQAVGPMGNPREMGADLATLPAKLAAIPGYAPMFERAFPGQGITLGTVTKALAVFERSLASGAAPFDRWVEGQEDAVSPAAKRGFVLFTGAAGCARCHSGWAFTDGRLHDIGLPGRDLGKPAISASSGAPLQEGEHGFKTPTLRNVGWRAPYMHDGSLATLTAVMHHYESGGQDRPSRSILVHKLALSLEDEADVIAFLGSLSEAPRSFPSPTLPR